MSFTVRDLRCEHGHVEISACYRVSDGTPACTECGGATATFYATREMEGQAALDRLDATLAQFGTVTLQGQKMTREELVRFKAEYAAHQGVDPGSIDFAPVGNNRERADFHRHRAWETRKKNGFDTQQFNEYKREQLRQH